MCITHYRKELACLQFAFILLLINCIMYCQPGLHKEMQLASSMLMMTEGWQEPDVYTEFREKTHSNKLMI